MSLPVRAVARFFGEAVIYRPTGGPAIELRAHVMSQPEQRDLGIVGLTDADQVLDFARADLEAYGLVPELLVAQRATFEVPRLSTTFSLRALQPARERESVFFVLGDPR